MIRYLKKEWGHFCTLPHDAQLLLFSFVGHHVFFPLLGVFSQAFLWRQGRDLVLLSLYASGIYIGSPIGFTLSCFLQRRIPLQYLYPAGLLLQMVGLYGLFFIGTLTYTKVLVVGVTLGLATGIYWSTRHLYSLLLTKASYRNYFGSIEFSSSTIFGIIMPLLYGAFLTFELKTLGFSPNFAYQLLPLILLPMVALLLYFTAMRIKMPAPPGGVLRLKTATKVWRRAGVVVFTFGFGSGLTFFLPAFLLLSLNGEEKELGIVQALAAACGAVVLYTSGRLVRDPRHLVTTLGLCGGFLSVSGVAILLDFKLFTVLPFILLLSAFNPIIWNAFGVLTANAVDLSKEDDAESNAYLLEREIILCCGRLFANFLFVLVMVIGGGGAISFAAPFLTGVALTISAVITKAILSQEN